jgi:hypothetical protein
MGNRIHNLIFVAIFSLGACGHDGPRLDSGDDEGVGGEIDGPIPEGCAPDDEFTHGFVLLCQGAGTGWLVTDVHGAGNANPITTCLAYEDPLNVPENPTFEDCASISLDKIPFDIPAPAACCNDEASEGDILATCELDCGYAACKTAVAAIRASADDLSPPPNAPEIVAKAFDTSRTDLHAYADMLDAPDSLEYCGEKVAAGAGEVVSLGLSGGVSRPAAFGHIKDATLYLGCSLDLDEAYVPVPSADECRDPFNIPEPTAEQDAGGPIQGGAVTVTGPGVDSVAKIHDATASTREVLDGDMSVDFISTSFEADVVGVAVGSFFILGEYTAVLSTEPSVLVLDP